MVYTSAFERNQKRNEIDFLTLVLVDLKQALGLNCVILTWEIQCMGTHLFGYNYYNLLFSKVIRWPSGNKALDCNV